MKLLDKIAELRKNIIGEDAVNAELAKKNEMNIKTNADEVHHTWNIWYWAELVPVDVLTDKIYNAVPKYSTFLDKLTSWFHWNDLCESIKLPINWEIGFAQGNAEWTTWA